MRNRLDTATALEETTRDYVQRLEGLVDDQRLPSGDDLIGEIERFLREAAPRANPERSNSSPVHDKSCHVRRYTASVRASRLVNLLLLLQSRGGMTAAELSRESEVSVRTVHRDVEELSAAGVPIFAERGPLGGIRLVDGYRTRLTGMTADEAEALFLAGLPGPAAQLGLGTVVAAAQLKVMAALPPELRSRASRIVERFHLDAASWFHADDTVPHLATLSAAVWDGRAVRISYERGKWSPRPVERRSVRWGSY